MGARRWRNISDTSAYNEAVARGVLPEAETRAISGEEQLQEALFMGLRLRVGVDLATLAATHGVDLAARYGEKLETFVTAGLLDEVGYHAGRLILTRRGQLLANEVLSAFV